MSQVLNIVAKNASTEPLIRGRNLVKKLKAIFEIINNMQTEFPQSRKFPRRGMHKVPVL